MPLVILVITLNLATPKYSSGFPGCSGLVASSKKNYVIMQSGFPEFLKVFLCSPRNKRCSVFMDRKGLQSQQLPESHRVREVLRRVHTDDGTTNSLRPKPWTVFSSVSGMACCSRTFGSSLGLPIPRREAKDLDALQGGVGQLGV